MTTAALPDPQNPGSFEPEVLHWIPLDQIVVAPQVRKAFDPDLLSGLAANIRSIGIQQPLTCYQRDGITLLLDGERRLRAAKLADLKRVPVRLVADVRTAEAIVLRQVSCNLQRQDLNLVEKAEGLRQFITESGLTAEKAADALGLSPAAACKTLAVLRLPEALQDRAAAGELSAEAAYLLVRITDPARQEALAARVIAGELNRDGLAAEIRKAVPAAPSATQPALVQQQTVKPTGPKPSVWRMTRTIGMGVALAITGTGLTLEELVTLLDAFVIRAREAIARKVPVARFLSEFRHDAKAAEGGAA